jgi:hypothetical protein
MDDLRVDEITVARRFCGPPGSANGGYTAGLVASAFRLEHTADAVVVTLRRPPPLDTAMTVRRTDDTVSHGPLVSLFADDLLVAEARAGELGAEPVEAVSFGDARQAETAYAGLAEHPFPGCFTCGPEREPGDALRLRPGPVDGARTACTWTPHESLAADDNPALARPEFVWACLDCPGGWTADVVGRPMVLGRITANVDAPAEIGERHVVMGQLLGHEGRKTFTATTLYDSDGRVVARAEHVWIAVDPGAFG